MTLIELLVVIIIMTTLVAAAIPLLSPSNDDRRLREATRGLNTYITGAQARAISTHRPYGIAFKRLSQDTNTNPNKKTDPTKDIHPDNGACLEVFYVEQQPPYSGFDANSRACVAIHPTLSGTVLVRFVTRGSASTQMQDGLPTGWDADLFPDGMIRPGDVIEINGTQFELGNPANNDVTIDSQTGYYVHANKIRIAIILARPLNDSGQQINPKHDDNGYEIGAVVQAHSPYWASPAPYKILRQPTPASDEPYQLPEGTAIDLRASGVGSGDFFYWPGLRDNSDGILIMFAPEGRVARVSYSILPTVNPSDGSTTFDAPVVDNIYLLVGRGDRIAAPPVGSDSTLQSAAVAAATTDEARAKLREPINWLSGDSRWVVIGSQSGRVATIENAAVDLASVLNTPAQPFQSASQSTEEMRSAQILAAREFTHEMGQLGGR
jgi:type II secretory pathway pseudopilin PulG